MLWFFGWKTSLTVTRINVFWNEFEETVETCFAEFLEDLKNVLPRRMRFCNKMINTT